MENQVSYSVIPSGELRCVWMDAGIAGFKLCDQEFRCDSCEFNKSVTQQQTEKTLSLSQEDREPLSNNKAITAEGLFRRTLKNNLDGLRSFEVPHDRMFTRSHFWIKQNEAGEYRIGINHIIANFFRPILNIVISKAPINIHKHDPFCWIILPSGAITLRSPLDAIISRFNPALHQKPNLLSTSPFEEGWIMEVSAKSKGLNGFISSVDSRQLMERMLHNVEHSFTQAFRHLHPTAGTTLFDGGIGLDNVESILGSKVYLGVVNRILHLPA